MTFNCRTAYDKQRCRATCPLGEYTRVCVMLENRAARAIKANKVHGARGNGRVVTAITK